MSCGRPAAMMNSGDNTGNMQRPWRRKTRNSDVIHALGHHFFLISEYRLSSRLVREKTFVHICQASLPHQSVTHPAASIRAGEAPLVHSRAIDTTMKPIHHQTSATSFLPVRNETPHHRRACASVQSSTATVDMGYLMDMNPAHQSTMPVTSVDRTVPHAISSNASGIDQPRITARPVRS